MIGDHKPVPGTYPASVTEAILMNELRHLTAEIQTALGAIVQRLWRQDLL
jgi:hypothetical protein